MSFTIPPESITPAAVTPPPVQPPAVQPPQVQSKPHTVDWPQDPDGTVHILVDGTEVGKVPPIGSPPPPPPSTTASVKQARYAQGNEYPLPNTARRKLIIFQGAWHVSDVQAYKQVNPSGIALCYVNATYDSDWNVSPMGSTLLSRAQANAIGAETGQTHPDGWHHQCNVGVAGYQAQAKMNIGQYVFGNSALWDGIFLDDVNWASNQVGIPTGYGSMADWRDRALVPLLSSLRTWRDASWPGKLIIANMNGTWGQWRNSPDASGYRPVLAQLDGGLDEFFGSWGPGTNPQPLSFVQGALANVDDCANAGKLHFGCTELFSSTDTQRALYGYCLALCATGSAKSYYNAHFPNADLWLSQFDLDVGTPTGPRVESPAGVFTRQFSKAKVTANQNTLTGTIA